MKKRILAIVLIICMVLTFVPTIVFANDTTYVVAGCAELCGTDWDPSPETSPDNVMEVQEDGTYKKTYTNVAVRDGYGLMIVENKGGSNLWYGADENVVFNVESVCDVTITFDPETKKITVTGAGVKLPTELNVESMRTVGNGQGNWLNNANWDPASDANKMTEVSPKVYEITYANVEKGDGYMFKFIANGSWVYNWGGVYQGSGIESVADYDTNNNITFNVPYDFSDITLRLDLTNYDNSKKTGATFKVTIVESHKHNFNSDWDNDNAYHWHNCLNADCTITGNSQKDGYGKHVDSDNNDICDVCNGDISFIITGRILTENGASIEGNMTGLANYKNKEEVTLNVPVIAGYNFVGWYEYSESSANKYTGENLCSSRTYTFTAEADRNLVAVYKPIGSAELTIDGGKSFTINGDSKTTEVTSSYPLGIQIEVVCNDSDFEYWKNSVGMVVSRDKSYTFTVTGKETISAVFNTIAENKATVAFESYYGQVIARDQYAADATLAETPGLPFRYGYTALGWDYNGDGTYDTSEGTEDTFAKALERGFASDNKLVKILPVYQLNEVTYQITVVNGTGAGTYKQNEVVTVVANAASEGNKFSHWADDAGNILSYNEKYQFYAAKNITVKAMYVSDFEVVEAKGTTEIVDKFADKANGKLTFVSMSTVPEGCTIDKAGMILTDDSDVASSEDGFNASTAKYALGNAWSGNAYRYIVNMMNVSVGDTWYVRAYLVYTDAEGNVNIVYGKIESLTMPK